ncbi:DUF6292 family protein [Streptomyces chartreusis]
MIRAGRRKYTQNSEDLAAAMGVTLGTFRNKHPYASQDFPPLISSDGARVKLWDAQQTAAHLAGRPVPALPAEDDDQDLLDRNEAAALLGISPKTWDDNYKKNPDIAPHLTRVKGVEHCPRGIVHAVRAAKDARGDASPKGGRPKGSGDMVPRDEIAARVGELLDENPAVTAATVQTRLGLSHAAAARALPRLRGEKIASLLQNDPELSPTQAAMRLGFPTALHPVAIAHAAVDLRARQVKPYVQSTADLLTDAGLAERQDVHVQCLEGDVVAAPVMLTGADTAALVWDERYGWRTAVSRRHPMGKDSGHPPQGEGIRYLSAAQQPQPADVLAALTDKRRGSRLPPVTHTLSREDLDRTMGAADDVVHRMQAEALVATDAARRAGARRQETEQALDLLQDAERLVRRASALLLGISAEM